MRIKYIFILAIITSTMIYSSSFIVKKSLEYNTTMQVKDDLYESTKEHLKERTKENALKELRKFTPAVYLKKGDKIIAFFDKKAFGTVPHIGNIELLEDASIYGVVMMVVNNGQSTYSMLKKGITYKDILTILQNQAKGLAYKIFEQGLIYLMPPPSNMFIIASKAGEILISYAINKYVELDKRNYVGLEDMLWDVPDEIKNKISILNIEDIKKETIFDFEDIDKDSILDEKIDGDTVFDTDEINKETILDY